MNFSSFLTTIAILSTATCLNAVGFSRLWICGAVGLLLPPVTAFFVAMISAVWGNYLIFLGCRNEWMRKRLRKIVELTTSLYSKAKVDAVGISGVVLARQMPLPSIVVSVLLANANVSRRDYLIGTAVGYAPSTVLTILTTGTAARFLPPHVTTVAACSLAVISAAVMLAKMARKTE